MSLIETTLQKLDVPAEQLDYAKTGIHARLSITSDQLQKICRTLKAAGFFLETITAVDDLAEGTMRGVWFFDHYSESSRLQIVIESSRDNTVFPTIGMIYPGAVWHERETAEFFDITFEGSKDSRGLLLPLDVTFHPLRKDFKRPKHQIAGIH